MSGLSNLDIEKEMKNVPGFQGCFVKGELEYPLKNGSYIVNLGTYAHGTHWVAVVKTPQQVYYYDSYGEPAFQSLVDHYPRYESNHTQVQPLDTSYCGQICMSFIRLMMHHSFFTAILKMNNLW